MLSSKKLSSKTLAELEERLRRRENELQPELQTGKSPKGLKNWNSQIIFVVRSVRPAASDRNRIDHSIWIRIDHRIEILNHHELTDHDAITGDAQPYPKPYTCKKLPLHDMNIRTKRDLQPSSHDKYLKIQNLDL